MLFATQTISLDTLKQTKAEWEIVIAPMHFRLSTLNAH